LRGIRHSVSHDPNFPDGIVIRPAPEGLLANRQYRAGLARLAARGLRYDAMLYHAQLPELTAMAQAMPDLAIVLDHIGCILGIGPYRGYETETFDQWRSAMADLAACPNVTVKIGGFGMIIGGASWHDRDMPPAAAELAHAWRPYVETCIEVFGAARCMFESNFPVDKAMYSYRTRHGREGLQHSHPRIRGNRTCLIARSICLIGPRIARTRSPSFLKAKPGRSPDWPNWSAWLPGDSGNSASAREPGSGS
jgi:hypothetical protein